MIITSIKAQKNQKRVNIYLDNSFSAKGGPASGWGFSLDLENYMKLGLKVNQELSQEEIKAITNEGEKAKALEKVLKFAMLRPRSKKEILDYFRRKHTNELIHWYILEKLKKYELLDDTKFAKWWVEQRLEFKSKSKKDITYELRQKGVDSNTIKNVLDDSEFNELKIAKELISKKEYKWKRYDERERKQKITQYLAGKGFSWDVISNLVSLRTK